MTFKQNLHISSGKAIQQIKTSQSSVLRVIKLHYCNPYKVKVVQEFSGDDSDRRLQYCQ